jgi:mono/diheme cytochrome c family protein
VFWTRVAVGAALAALLGGAAFWALTIPRGLSAAEIAALPEGDATRGEVVFHAGGCTSCHAAPGATGADKLRLAGGLRLNTDFGTFVVPNVSPDPTDGIGVWSLGDFADAMLRGVSPEGAHLYPSFPYTSYARMTHQDVADLWAYLGTLPPVPGATAPNELAFPYNLRRGIGLWKLLYLSDAPVIAVDEADPVLLRGRYLVEGPGHCAECHTPRDLAGGLEASRWLAGGPNPDGEGRIPNITGGAGGIGDWSAADIAYYLETGFTPDFDSVGGSMVAVQANMALLPPEDRAAMAAYLKAVPPQDD